MEPLKATTAWQSYTPTVDELLQNQTHTQTVQVVQAALSVATDAQLGPMVDSQGTDLRYLDSITVKAGTAVNYRTTGPTAGIAAIGRNPA